MVVLKSVGSLFSTLVIVNVCDKLTSIIIIIIIIIIMIVVVVIVSENEKKNWLKDLSRSFVFDETDLGSESRIVYITYLLLIIHDEEVSSSSVCE